MEKTIPWKKNMSRIELFKLKEKSILSVSLCYWIFRGFITSAYNRVPKGNFTQTFPQNRAWKSLRHRRTLHICKSHKDNIPLTINQSTWADKSGFFLFSLFLAAKNVWQFISKLIWDDFLIGFKPPRDLLSSIVQHQPICIGCSGHFQHWRRTQR